MVNDHFVDIPLGWSESQLATAAVLAMHQGHLLLSPALDFFRAAVTTWQWDLQYHPLWLSVSTLLPPRCIIRRLAHCILGPAFVSNETFDSFLMPCNYGYCSVQHFTRELAALTAWYDVPRANAACTQLDVVSVVASRLGGTGARVHAPTRDLPRPSASLAADARTGVMGTAKVRHAVHNLSEETTARGLVANQRLGAVAKGALPAPLPSYVCVNLFFADSHPNPGSSSNESLHSFFQKAMAKVTSSIDTLECVLGCVTLVYNQVRQSASPHVCTTCFHVTMPFARRQSI